MAAPMHTWFSAALAAFTLTAASGAQDAEQRIVSVGGDVTEIVYALGYGDQIVATDSTSVWPPEARDTPKVGYVRSLAAESVLSLSPTLLILGGAAGPEEVVDQLRAVGLELVELDSSYTIESVRHKVEQVAEALGEEAAGQAMIAQIDADWAEAQQVIAGIEGRPRALFFASLGDGGPRSAGAGTAAHGIMEALGVENAFAGQQGYQALSTEAAVAANPDVIFAMSHNVRDMGGIEAVAADPAIALTDAGRNLRIIEVDSVRVMSFGPRFAEGMADVARDLDAVLEASQPVR